MALGEVIAGSYLRNTRDAVNSNLARNDAGMTQSQWDAWYQEQLAKSGLSGSLLEQARNNPYGSYQAPALNYFESLWKGLTGVSAKEQDFYNQRQQSAQEYLAQLQDVQRQQAFNDPAAQMAREKAAGLNPELSGGEGISSGEAAGAAPDDTPPNVQGTADEIGQVGNIMGLGFSLFQNAFSAIGAIQQIYGNSLNNSEKELSLTDQGWNQLIKLAAESSDWQLDAGQSILDLTPEDFDRKFNENTHSLLDRLTNGEFSNMYDRKVTRTMMKRLESILGDGGTQTLAYKKFRSGLMKEIVGDTTSAAEGLGKFGFSDNILLYGQKISETFSNIEKEARKAASRIANAQAYSQEAIAGYNQEYYSPELGAEEGSAALETARARKAQVKLDSYIDQQLDGLVDSLRGRGDIGSLILTFMIASMRSVVKSSALSFGPKGIQMSM